MLKDISIISLIALTTWALMIRNKGIKDVVLDPTAKVWF